ncbi:hypothetical protein H0H92_008037, partial [Tricholoma furcatifolium]
VIIYNVMISFRAIEPAVQTNSSALINESTLYGTFQFTKKLQLSFAYIELLSLQDIKHDFNVSNVILKSIRINDNIIKIYVHELADVWGENMLSHTQLSSHPIVGALLQDTSTGATISVAQQP